MSVFPLTQEVTRLRAGPSGRDAHGNEITGPPTEDQILVFAWWIGSSGEPGTAGHVERVESDASMISAPGDFKPSDRVALPGHGVFEEIGRASCRESGEVWVVAAAWRSGVGSMTDNR